MCALSIVLFFEVAEADTLSGSSYHWSYIGGITASGAVHSGGFEAATNVYPLGTVVEVCYQGACASPIVVNDTCGDCGIDLGQTAADAIGLTRVGRAPVDVTVL